MARHVAFVLLFTGLPATHLLDAIAGNKTLFPGRLPRVRRANKSRERSATRTTVLGRVTSNAADKVVSPPGRFS